MASRLGSCVSLDETGSQLHHSGKTERLHEFAECGSHDKPDADENCGDTGGDQRIDVGNQADTGENEEQANYSWNAERT